MKHATNLSKLGQSFFSLRNDQETSFHTQWNVMPLIRQGNILFFFAAHYSGLFGINSLLALLTWTYCPLALPRYEGGNKLSVGRGFFFLLRESAQSCFSHLSPVCYTYPISIFTLIYFLIHSPRILFTFGLKTTKWPPHLTHLIRL